MSGPSTSTWSRGASGCRGRGRRSRTRASTAIPGGKGANQAVAAARLGAEVTFVGSVGDDEFADEALAGLREAGVETVLREGGATGVAVIIVDARGENQIVVAPGANAELHDPQPSGAVLSQLEIPVDAVRAAAAERSASSSTRRLPGRSRPSSCEPRRS